MLEEVDYLRTLLCSLHLAPLSKVVKDVLNNLAESSVDEGLSATCKQIYIAFGVIEKTFPLSPIFSHHQTNQCSYDRPSC